MKKKILVVSQNFFPETFPINDVIFNLKKFSKTVITTFPTYPNLSTFLYFDRYKFKSYVSNYKDTKIVRVPSYPRRKNSLLNFALTYLSFLISGSIYSLLFYKKKFDYIFVYATSPVIQALIGVFLKKFVNRDSKLIIWLQDLWPESISTTGYIKNKFILKNINILVNYIYKNSDLILTQSDSLKINLEKKIKLKKIYTLPNPSKNFYLRRKKNNKKFNILYAGNLGKIQNLEILLKLSKKLKLKSINDINIIIAGRGSEEKKIKNFKKKFKLDNLNIVGLKNFEEMKKIYSEADLLFLSLKKTKISRLIIPSKFQSYLSSGKPILTTLEGDVLKIINEYQCGFYCNSNNINLILKKILFIKKLPKKKLIAMGLKGRDYYLKNFSKEIIQKKLNKIIDRIDE